MGHESDQRAVLIAGPTASGKSAVALALAEELGGIVINADAMQVYGDLRVLTARPTQADEKRAPHWLYGHVDATENYSVGRWLADVTPVLAQARQAGQVAIVVGGTGLYFKALTRGLAAVPPIPADIRVAVRARLEREGSQALHAELARRDPVTAARLTPNDRPRIARALEVVEATGRALSDWHREGLVPLIDASAARKVFLAPERAELYRRIDTRFSTMLEQGALAEVRALDARRLDPALPAMKAHGVPWLRRHLHGEIALETAMEGARQDTRHYAKRQFTWARHQLPDWTWTGTGDALADVLRAFGR